PWQWIDRLPWSDERIREHLATPGIEIWLVSHQAVPAGFVELSRALDGSVEIVYFGLLPEFIGRQAGRAFLDAALREAWRAVMTRPLVRLIAAMLLVAASPRPAAAADPLPLGALTAVRVTTAPIIDGTLDDAVWRGPELPTGPWASYNPLHGATIPQQTHVWI